MIFNLYAKYYNLLYKDKDYAGEVAFVDGLIKKFSTGSSKKLLDIGCGTGVHAQYMTENGYQVTGVDLSAEMITQARNKNIPGAIFHEGNATTFNLNKKFDVVTSLFHVMSYQTTNEQARAMIHNACKHLHNGGLFLFDFWYGPAVLSEKPAVKIRRLENEELKVTRIAEPVLKLNENLVEVNFELNIQDKINNSSSVIRELHPMRYFFKPEITLLLENESMRMLYFNEWMTGATPSDSSWGVCCLATKEFNAG
jgi:SAM-dependent methyltransferase